MYTKIVRLAKNTNIANATMNPKANAKIIEASGGVGGEVILPLF